MVKLIFSHLMVQFWIPKNTVQNQLARLEGEEAHHARDVFRMKEGDSIRLFDGEGNGYQGKIRRISEEAVEAEVLSSVQAPSKPSVSVVLGQSMIPRERMDEVVEKATELGALEIIPVLSQRSIIRLSLQKRKAKKSHWEKVALSACKQCDRLDLPKIHEVVKLEELLKDLKRFAGR